MHTYTHTEVITVEINLIFKCAALNMQPKNKLAVICKYWKNYVSMLNFHITKEVLEIIS